MRVGVSSASPTVWSWSKGHGAIELPALSTISRRTSEKPLEWTPELASPRMTSPGATPSPVSAWPRSTAPTRSPRGRSRRAAYMPGISAVSPPISAQPPGGSPRRCPRRRRGHFVVELAGGEIVEEEQRLGALDDEVVDAHRDQVDADAVMLAGVDGQLELGADAVVGGDEQRVVIARGLEVEEAAEAAQFGVGAGRAVDLASGAIALTRALPAAIDTPASA